MSVVRYRVGDHHAWLVAFIVIATSLLLAAPARADQLSDAGAPGLELKERSGFSLGVRVENGNQRSFRQVEPTTGEVRTYDARVYAGIGVELHYDQSFAEDRFSWSLCADYFRSLLFKSGSRRLGSMVETTAQRAGVLGGLSLHPLATTRALSLGLHAGVGAMGFDFALPSPQSSDDETMQLATGNYTLASAGAGARLPVSALAFSVRGSYLRGLRTGAFGGRTALEQPHGLDALAVVEYRILSWLDVTVRGGVTVLWLDLAPIAERPSDAPANVRDLYLALGLGLRAHL